MNFTDRVKVNFNGKNVLPLHNFPYCRHIQNPVIATRLKKIKERLAFSYIDLYINFRYNTNRLIHKKI